jgi:serine/threonine protein kinase
MEYCQRGDLCNYLHNQNGKTLSDNFIWKVIINVTLGVHYLHSQDIIHRDLKTQNILLTKDFSAKIADFGTARKLDASGKTLSDQPDNEKVGTPFYLAPEVWNDKPCTKKSDVWALGVIFHELCALKVPFQAEDVNELTQKVLNEKPPQLPHTIS